MMETVTMTLSDFLLARIAEDEAALQADLVGREFPNPRRFAAECEAKRRIVEVHGIRRDVDEMDYCDSCADWYGGSAAPFAWPCPTLRDVAHPYADHPDFRPEWRA